MDVTQMVSNMTPEVYENLKTAVELGKWPDGTALNEAQKENTLQLVMAYQSVVLKSKQHFNVGEDGKIVQLSKSQLKNQHNPDAQDPSAIARFNHDDL